MSVDFAVFDPDFAPREGRAFREWYEEQMDWDIDANDPPSSILSPSLLNWYNEMAEQFPDMHRSDVEGSQTIDYSFNSQFIYCSMAATKEANSAWSKARHLANELALGTYDCMSDDGRDNRCIVFPDGPLKNEPSLFSKLFGKTKD